MGFKGSYRWAALALALAVAGGIVAARWLRDPPVPLASGTWLAQPRTLPEFELSDFKGGKFGRAALQGHPTLLFFGFTYCPDVCPTTLATIAGALKSAPLPGARVVFVTVDPERDTPDNLRRYLGAFSGDFIGVRGEREALSPLLKALGALAQRVELPDGGYTMDHSVNVYLFDSRGRWRAVFTPPHTSSGLSADFARIKAAGAL